MKRYLMSSNSIMNLNDKKSLDFQSISIDQNNNFGISSVLRLFKIFAISYHLNKIFIQFQFYQGRQYGAVCQPVQRSETGTGRVTLVPWLLNIFSQHGGKKYLCKILSKIFCTHRTLCCICRLVWLTRKRNKSPMTILAMRMRTKLASFVQKTILEMRTTPTSS